MLSFLDMVFLEPVTSVVAWALCASFCLFPVSVAHGWNQVIIMQMSWEAGGRGQGQSLGALLWKATLDSPVELTSAHNLNGPLPSLTSH